MSAPAEPLGHQTLPPTAGTRSTTHADISGGQILHPGTRSWTPASPKAIEKPPGHHTALTLTENLGQPLRSEDAAQPMPWDGGETSAQCLRPLQAPPGSHLAHPPPARCCTSTTHHLQQPEPLPGSPVTRDGCYGSPTPCSGQLELGPITPGCCVATLGAGWQREVSKPCATDSSQGKDGSGSLWQGQELSAHPCTQTRFPYPKGNKSLGTNVH